MWNWFLSIKSIVRWKIMYYLMSENYFIQLLNAIKDCFIEEIKIGDIGTGIREAIITKEIFRFSIGGTSISISENDYQHLDRHGGDRCSGLLAGTEFQRYSDKKNRRLAEGLSGLLLNLCKGQGMSTEQAAGRRPPLPVAWRSLSLCQIPFLFSNFLLPRKILCSRSPLRCSPLAM